MNRIYTPSPKKSAVLAAVVIFIGLALLFSHYFRALHGAHSLYLTVIDDPAPRWSFYPWDVLSAREIRAGYFPLWNAWSATGLPHLANLQSTPLNPWKWPFYLIPDLRVMDYMILLRVVLLWVFVFLLAQKNNLGLIPASAAAFIFCFCGYAVRHVNEVDMATEMWLPLMLLLVQKQVEDGPRLWRTIMAGAVAALAYIGGNPEAAFYFVLVTVIWGFLCGSEKAVSGPAKIAAIIAPLLLGGLMVQFQILPFIEYLGSGWHIHNSKMNALAEHDINRFWSLAMPWLVGPNRSADLQHELLPYLGIVPLLLSLIGLINIRSEKKLLIPCLVLIVLLFGIIYRVPPLGYINLLPVFRETASVKFAVPGAFLAVALSAGVGLKMIIEHKIHRRQQAVALAAMLLLMLGGILNARFDEALPGVVTAGWFPSMLLLIAAGALLVAYQRRERGRAILGLLMLFLVALNYALLFPDMKPMSDIDRTRWSYQNPSPPQFAAALFADRDLPRFTATGSIFHHSQNLIYNRISDLRAFDGLYPRRYVEALGKIEGFTMGQSVDNFFSHGWSFDVQPQNIGHPLVDALGVKYILTDARLNKPGAELIQGGTVNLYINRGAFPRAFFSAGLDELKPDEGQVEIKAYDDQRVEMNVISERAGNLILTDTYFPGWLAELDRAAVRIKPALDLVRAVPVPAGEHRIVMYYRPVGFRIGLWMSLTTIMVSLFLLFAKKEPEKSLPQGLK